MMDQRIEDSLNNRSDYYERVLKMTPVPYPKVPSWPHRHMANALGHDGEVVTGENITHIENWRGYPIAHVDHFSFATGASFVLPPGMIVMPRGIKILGSLNHEAYHFRDWIKDRKQFYGWLKTGAKVPIIGALLTPMEWRAYAGQLSFWKKPESIDGPAARRWISVLRQYWRV